MQTVIEALKRWRPYMSTSSDACRFRLLPDMFDIHQLAIGAARETKWESDPARALEIAMGKLEYDKRHYARETPLPCALKLVAASAADAEASGAEMALA